MTAADVYIQTPPLLTAEEAMLVLRIGRSNVYESANRFLATGGDFLNVVQTAKILKEGAGAAGRKVPTRTVPNWLLRVVALFDPEAKGMLPELGKRKNASNEKAQRILGWTPRSPAEAILASASSLMELGLLKSG